ncbi:MAG TPA: hypothetical protein VGB24_08245 [Longimicrobium sp.]|jgi:uncharacterized membrane protein|uniref:hypothetical protein n=1 Tax=Longimicrobium sp. TaxID=2029185 RepID=UPI002ED9CAE9
MQPMLVVHIAAGSVALLAGYTALAAAKGASVHRKSGVVFVGAMTVMGVTGAAIAAMAGVETTVTGGVLSAYLVITALTTVRPSTPAIRRLEFGAMLVALAGGLATLGMCIDSVSRGEFARDGIPVPMIFLFAAVALLSAGGDVRMIRAGGIRGPSRLVRHLWRMCFALWIAAGSFFLGQADEFPAQLRNFALLSVPVLVPLVAMVYWRWRIRGGKPVRGRARTPAPAVA